MKLRVYSYSQFFSFKETFFFKRFYKKTDVWYSVTTGEAHLVQITSKK